MLQADGKIAALHKIQPQVNVRPDGALHELRTKLCATHKLG
jgi:hypothetical protein